MSAPLRSLKYTLQHNHTTNGSSLDHLLLSFMSSHTVAHQNEVYWDVACVGRLLPNLQEQVSDAWSLANIDGVERTLYFESSTEVLTDFDEWPESTKSLHQQLLSFKKLHQGSQEEKKKTLELLPNEVIQAQVDTAQAHSDDELDILGADLDTSEFSLETLSELVVLDSNNEDHQNSQPSIHSNLMILINEVQSLYVPKVENLKQYDSIIVIIASLSVEVLVWKRWAAKVGARILFLHDTLVTELSEVIQSSSYTAPRQSLEIIPAEGVGFQSLTVLSPQASPLQIETKSGSRIYLTLAPTLNRQRSSFLLAFQESSSESEGARLLCSCLLNGVQHNIYTQAQRDIGIEQHQMAVSFAHQLSHRARCFDGLLYTYSRKELRRVVQYLDQWLKLSIAMGNETLVEKIYQLKVKFSSVGYFHKKELHELIISGLQTPFVLNEAGEWVES